MIQNMHHIDNFSKVLIVAGGAGTSSETLVVGPGNVWQEAKPLPRVLVSVSFASLDNKFYILGNCHNSGQGRIV